MKLYELIISLDPSLSSEDSQSLISQIEALFPGGIKEKDDIGYQTVYNVHGLKYGAKAYFVSYCIQIDPTLFGTIKQKMSLMKWILRSVFLARSSHDQWIVFKDIQEEYQDILSKLVVSEKKAKKTKDQKQHLLDAAQQKQEQQDKQDETIWE